MPGFVHLRHGLRLLARSPVFAITSVLVLAVGICANGVIFSIVDALLLRELPVKQPERLVRLTHEMANGFRMGYFASEVCHTVAASNDTFSSAVCQGQLDVALKVGDAAERVRLHLVSPNFFSTLGVGPHVGRTFSTNDETQGESPAVLSHAFWQRRFRGDRSVLGRTVVLNGVPFVVVGVSAASFSGLEIDTSPDIRVLSSAGRQLTSPGAEGGIPSQLFALLRDGQTIEAAEAEIEPLVQAVYGEYFERQFPGEEHSLGRGKKFHLEPIAHGISKLRTRFRSGVFVLAAGVGFLLIIACANVAGLLLARTVDRGPELSVRMALGAGRWQIAGQLLAESLPLALFGGLAGMLLTYTCLPLVVGLIPPVRDNMAVVQPLALTVQVDDKVLLFTAVAALVSVLLFGLAPALIGSRVDLMSKLRSATTSTRPLAVQKAIVVAQVATCTVLVLGAALLTKTLEQTRSTDSGFDGDRIVTFTIDPSMLRYDADRTDSLTQQLTEQTRSLPTVSAASIAVRGLMRGTGLKTTLAPAGERITQQDFMNCSLNRVTEDYFETMGMRLVAGRDFVATDRNEAKPQKVVVNQTLVRRFFPEEDPIGQRIGYRGDGGLGGTGMQIVGVVTDSKYRSLREEIHPVVYTHADKDLRYGFVLHVRTEDANPETAIGPVREILRSLDPELPLIEINVLEDEVEVSLWQERLLATLSSVFGGIAALLAAIGLFGAHDYAVGARTREIGLRVALGAGARDIGGMLWRESIGVFTAGVTLGLCVHLALAEWIRQVLYEVHPFDTTALMYALVIVAAACIIATLPPNTRAVRIRPGEVLRHE